MRQAIFSIALFLITLPLFAQDVNNLAIEGIVKDGAGNKITNATITLIQDGAQIDRVTTGKNGRFDLYLEFGHEFIVAISKPDHVTKRLAFNTNNVPEDEQMWGYEYGGIIVELFKELDGVDYSILNKPTGKFYYEPNVENFVTDNLYARGIKDQLSALEDEYRQKLKDQANQEKQLERDYQMALKDAENALADGDLDLARDNISAASNLKPNEAKPKQLLAQLESKENADQARKGQYDEAIAKADEHFNNKDYGAAKGAYNDALKIVPNSSYPLAQIVEADKKIKEAEAAKLLQTEKELEEKKYTDAIAAADLAFNSEKFRDAKTLYQNALALKDDQYPKSQLGIIDSKLADLAAQKEASDRAASLEAQYNTKIDKADAAFNSESWTAAQGHYKAALEIKPNESYPTSQLDLVNQKLNEAEEAQLAQAEAAEQGKQYQKLIVNGDRAMKIKNYEKAKSDFESALKIKPSESYPKEQIELIAQRMDEENQRKANALAEARKIEKYKQTIVRADEELSKESYNLAASLYQEAQTLDPTNDYPGQQLAKISQIQSKAKANQEKKDAYNAAIAAADAAFEKEDFINARVKYSQAIAILSTEDYPKDQMNLIDEKLKKREAAQAEDRNKRARFNDFMKAGNEAIVAENWSDARESFNEAINLMPSDPTPMNKLKTVDQLEQKAKEKAITAEYNALISEADKAFLTEDYDQAMLKYNAALNVKAGEVHPQMRIEKIKLILAEMKEERVPEEVAIEKRVEEEEYEEGRSKVTIRRVIEGNKVQVYKRVVHAWGGKYFFLDEQPITELVWNRETTK